MKQEKKDDIALNTQAIIKANTEKLRHGQFVGRSLRSHLPFPHNLLHEKTHAKGLTKQRNIPLHY